MQAEADIRARLERETRVEHDAIERTLAELTGDTLTLARYCHRLVQLHGFHRAVEERLVSVPGLDLRERRKTPLLESDLVALGIDERYWRTCTEIPRLDTTEERFGCLYVLEGSTLGGRIISRHLHRSLGVTPRTGGRFFHGYGARTGAMWREFRAALAAHAEVSESPDEIVAAAIATFRALRSWCESGHVLAARGGQGVVA
ncbi:biliverdin-producing heme oxygenase [Paraliomyxa miuraensis]|uniref:biliverdin-producing heme oxygenase n=1 Tax=Paraliomyxa miuraensis TaxID=376150 RepID=UPI00225BD1F7|nr:biliverdin-producing heme oxygenase [Paraliomyxa miuraensis]MCX4247079.1 biliverdin-producing heme oxygenase [Paraliomyxa miuraensis]